VLTTDCLICICTCTCISIQGYYPHRISVVFLGVTSALFNNPAIECILFFPLSLACAICRTPLANMCGRLLSRVVSESASDRPFFLPLRCLLQMQCRCRCNNLSLISDFP
jgi:hypothetical protein